MQLCELLNFNTGADRILPTKIGRRNYGSTYFTNLRNI